MSKMDLGLGDMSDFTPESAAAKAPGELRQERASIDAISREQGFGKPAQPALKLGRRKSAHAGEAMHQLSLKGPVSVMARFIEHCDTQNVPYWEALERMMDELKIGRVSPRGAPSA